MTAQTPPSNTDKLRFYRAAGGVVLDHQGRVLLIERWVVRQGRLTHEIRLPKGHVEPGEKDAEAALREVCEETGYCRLAVLADLGEAVTEFELDGEFVRRVEHYYLMRLIDTSRQEPHFDRPDADEARFRPRWARDLTEAEDLLTFASEKMFVRRARAQEWPKGSIEHNSGSC
jgi:8-oxo-dGTP pyrophosphatase MutT (NUDIX family)